MKVDVLEERYEPDGSYFVKLGCNGRWLTAGCTREGNPAQVKAKASRRLIEDVQWHAEQKAKATAS